MFVSVRASLSSVVGSRWSLLRRLAQQLLMLLVVASCSDGPSGPKVGSLEMTVTGLLGTSVTLTLTGPDGNSRSVTPGERIAALPPGRYTLVAPVVTVDGMRYEPQPASVTIDLKASTTALPVSVTYQLVTGALAVTLAGPAPDSAAVIVRGPSGFERRLVASTVLRGLTPGSYTIAAASVVSGGHVWAGTPATQTVVVSASLTPATGTAAFQLQTGALGVTLSSVPPGATTTVTVNGPSGFTRSLTSSSTLTGLVPGRYTVAAAPLTYLGQRFDPRISLTEISITASLTPVVSEVVYEQSTGSLALTSTGLPAGTAPVFTVTGPDGVTRSVTGAQTLNGLTPGTHVVRATSIAVDGQRYDPQPTEQTVTVRSGVTASARVEYRAATGRLTVQIAGLPTGAAAVVTITGPAGFARVLSQPQTLSGLEVGVYTVRAAAVTAEGQRFDPTPTEQTVSVTTSAAPVASIEYRATSGQLALQITGLPSGVASAVTVTGAAGFSRSITASQTLTGLTPGSYTVSAQPVTSAAVVYAPTPATQTITVVATSTPTTATISYAATSGSVALVVSGLPTGTGAVVTLSGPGPSSQLLDGTRTVTGLTPGSYTLTAQPVQANGVRYEPDPATQTVVVIASVVATPAFITYRPPAVGSLTVTVSGANGPLPSDFAVLGSIQGPNGFRRLLAVTQRFTGIEPGVYTILPNTSFYRGTYFALPASQQVTVAAGANVTATVNYVQESSGLDLFIGGLPLGTGAEVELLGPFGFTTRVSSTRILRGLPRGTYTIRPEPVYHIGTNNLYSAQPATQVVTLTGTLYDADPPVPAQVLYNLSRGNVRMTITGAPDGGPGDVVLTGPGGFSRPITVADGWVTGLAAGVYTITARDVTSGGNRWEPTLRSQTLTVSTLGTFVQAYVEYTRTTGDFDLEITGAPAGTARVTVTGPNGYSQLFTASQSLRGLTAGSYTVRAEPIIASGVRFDVSTAPQTIRVTTSGRAGAIVQYQTASARLQVNVVGVPVGRAAAISVAGPLGVNELLTGSATLTNLAGGAYTVTASPIGSGATLLVPSPTTQTVSLSMATQQTITISYAPPPDLRIAAAYFVQTVQTTAGSIPLVAGKAARLRVFGVTDRTTSGRPTVRVRLFDAIGSVIATQTITAPSGGVPGFVNEASAATSWDWNVPASLIQPGLRFLLDFDPENSVQEVNDSNNSFPATGAPQPLTVITMPAWNIRFVPVRQGGTSLTGNVSTANLSEWLDFPGRVWPVQSFNASVRPLYTSNAGLLSGDDRDRWSATLAEIDALRVADGASPSTYYYGAVRLNYDSGILGIGYVPGRTSIGTDAPVNASTTLAHELGHNLGRSHAPCGNVANADPSYPYRNGAIGVYGFDFGTNTIVPSFRPDLMSYCSPEWVSDYSYRAAGVALGGAAFASSALRGDDAVGAPSAVTVGSESAPVVLVWGRVSATGEVVVEPTFRLTTRPSLPTQTGAWRVEGVTQTGEVLFSHAFRPTPVADARDGDAHFAFAIPIDEARYARLHIVRVVNGARVTQRRATLAALAAGSDGDSEVLRTTIGGGQRLTWDVRRAPMALVRDARTGTILSFARNGAVDLSFTGDVDVQLSDGVRSHTSKVRLR